MSSLLPLFYTDLWDVSMSTWTVSQQPGNLKSMQETPNILEILSHHKQTN